MKRIEKKRFLPSILFACLCWIVFFYFLFFVDPEIVINFLIPGSYLPFFLSLFFAIFLTGSFIFFNTRRGFLLALGVVTFLYLRLYGLDHLLNLILLISFILVLEFAASLRS
ncbi:hypothetical protein A2Z23_00940 [Candidatus Curtissbacteria bacterium RBG_16_39_7]|uniref:Uncharacterized protein n=1 Tax=Candidatus Curtissbacteria bacterium RBG_16_39_7 TaxID=1797707 RepID=A0A1F5G2W9_9BACT|nr:MAG: hypothetical protein A2Z23_00940 [Candidatus Curtissbacteria bacterium RBG_16_39_7]